MAIGDVFKAFLCDEKVVFHSSDWLRVLNRRTTTECNRFFQRMWEAIAGDERLDQEHIDFTCEDKAMGNRR
jgi:hypothetical protein